MMNMGYSLWGVLILIGDIWAIINIFQSSVSNEKKLIWIIAVVLLPLLGLILWFFLGPRERKAYRARLIVTPAARRPITESLRPRAQATIAGSRGRVPWRS